MNSTFDDDPQYEQERLFYYRSLPKDDTEIEGALQQSARERPKEDFRKAYDRLHEEGRPMEP